MKIEQWKNEISILNTEIEKLQTEVKILLKKRRNFKKFIDVYNRRKTTKK